MSTIEVHGNNSTGTRPNITAEVTTAFSGWSGTTPLYTVTITLNGLGGYSYFGYNLYIYLNGEDKLIKGNSPSQWSAGVYSVTFYNVPYNTQPSIHSDNCGCGWWDPSGSIYYEPRSYNKPGAVTNLSVTSSVLNKSDNINLNWSAPSGGTGGISGYRIYYKTGSSYTHIATTSGTSYTTKISSFNNNITRGTVIKFMVVPYNSDVSGPNGNDASCTFAQPTINLSSQNILATSTEIAWDSNISIKKVEWKLSSESSYKPYYSGASISSGVVKATGLNYNSTYTINVRLTGSESDEQFNRNIVVTTLDIARIQSYETEWSVEDSTNLTISNTANLAMQLYISYNNIELISRTNITLNNGVYTLTLTDTEKNMLYNLTASDNNPSFKFILKSYSEGTKVGEDVKNTKITFPTKAWVKIDNVWKRALVWIKVGTTWKQSIPWVKIGSTWKRI